MPGGLASHPGGGQLVWRDRSAAPGRRLVAAGRSVPRSSHPQTRPRGRIPVTRHTGGADQGQIAARTSESALTKARRMIVIQNDAQQHPQTTITRSGSEYPGTMGPPRADTWYVGNHVRAPAERANSGQC